MLRISILGLGLDYLLMALSPTLRWRFVGRVLSGMTAAGSATATAYIADVTPPEKRAGAFGLVGAASGFGFVAGALALLNAADGLFVLPEPLPPERRSPFRLARANLFGSLNLLRSHHERFGLAATSFFYTLGHTDFPSVFVLWAGYVLHWDTRAVGDAAGFILYGITATVRLLWVGVLVYSPAGFFNPSMMGLMSRRVGQSEQRQLQGANSSIMGIVGMVGTSDTRRAPD